MAPEKPPKVDKFVRSVMKTLILKSYSKNAEIARELRQKFNVRTRREQKKKLEQLDIEKEDYDYYNRLLKKPRVPRYFKLL